VLPLPAGPVEVAVTQVAFPETPRLKVAVTGQPVSDSVRVAVTTALERVLGLRIDLTEFYQLLRASHRKWKSGMTFWQKLSWWLGNKPSRPFTVDWPPGAIM
jgi:hypothetical protein